MLSFAFQVFYGSMLDEIFSLCGHNKVNIYVYNIYLTQKQHWNVVLAFSMEYATFEEFMIHLLQG